MKKLLLASAMTAAFAAAHAAPVTFKPTGFAAVSNISFFDWSAASVYADNGNQAFANYVNSNGACPNNSCNFTVYAQGSLSAFKDAGNATLASGLGTQYQVTYQLAFEETVTFAAALPNGTNIAQFGFVPGGTNVFDLYYNAPQIASDLNGTGFTAGTQILTANVAPSGFFTSGFTAQTNPASIVPIGGANQTTPAAWGAANTVVGAGATSDLDVLQNVTILDASFFPNQILQQFLFSNLSQNLPFTTVDPTLFYQLDGGPVLNVKNLVSGNGGLNGGSAVGPNGVIAFDPGIMFQTDPNSPVSAKYLPEPATLALMSLGLLGLGGARRRTKA